MYVDDSYSQFMGEFAPIHVLAIVINYNSENTDMYFTNMTHIIVYFLLFKEICYSL